MTPFIHPTTGVPLKLGRTLARRNAKSRLRAASMKLFLDVMPTAPAAFDNTSGITAWGMMANDTLGDCTIAGPGHLIQAWTAAAGAESTVPDSVIVAAYSAWDGYIVGDSSTDQGGDLLTVCQDWQANGLGGHQISAHAEVNMTQLRWQQGIWIFGGLNAGVNLPLSAQDQVGSVWDIVGDGQTGASAPGSWGGHCVAVVGYDTAGITLVTWGALQRATWAWTMLYFDEAHCIISPEWTPPGSLTANSVVSDLQQIGS